MSTPPAPLILVIDDEPDLIETLRDALELAGHYRVMSVNDGVAGLKMVEHHPPDCIVVDVRMPHLNGIQFVRAMCGDPTTFAIPIVMLSALIQEEDVLSGLLSGADVYLRKPVRVQELLTAIVHALHFSQVQRDEQGRNLAYSPSEKIDAAGS